MNISALVQMLDRDPTLANDVPGWLARLNAATVRRVVQQRQVIVNDVEETVSPASIHGGPATAADVAAALAAINRRPLHTELRRRYERTMGAIDSGEVTTAAQVVAKLREALPADGS